MFSSVYKTSRPSPEALSVALEVYKHEPILILAGIIGTAQDGRALSSTASVVFWVGIVFLVLVIVGTIAPRDWVFDPRNTPQPNLTFLALRCLFLISVATLLAVLFRSLKKTKYTAALGANDGRE
jgi:arginine exporter protein ArgO